MTSPAIRLRRDLLVDAAQSANLASVASILSLPETTWAWGPGDAGHTPLTAAVKGGSLACVQALLDAGANQRFPDADGLSALFWAAQRGDASLVALLLPGADADVENNAGNDALRAAAIHGSAKCIPLLLTRFDPRRKEPCSGFDALMTAAAYGNAACVLALLPNCDQGARSTPTGPGWDDKDALMIAAAERDLACVQALAPGASAASAREALALAIDGRFPGGSASSGRCAQALRARLAALEAVELALCAPDAAPGPERLRI